MPEEMVKADILMTFKKHLNKRLRAADQMWVNRISMFKYNGQHGQVETPVCWCCTTLGQTYPVDKIYLRHSAIPQYSLDEWDVSKSEDSSQRVRCEAAPSSILHLPIYHPALTHPPLVVQCLPTAKFKTEVPPYTMCHMFTETLAGFQLAL